MIVSSTVVSLQWKQKYREREIEMLNLNWNFWQLHCIASHPFDWPACRMVNPSYFPFILKRTSVPVDTDRIESLVRSNDECGGKGNRVRIFTVHVYCQTYVLALLPPGVVDQFRHGVQRSVGQGSCFELGNFARSGEYPAEPPGWAGERQYRSFWQRLQRRLPWTWKRQRLRHSWWPWPWR